MEVPITFEDRKRGYSKAKIISYTLDVLKFGIKVRLQRSKTFAKFLAVGTFSYFVNAIALGLLYRGNIYSLRIISKPLLAKIPEPATLKIFSLPIDRLLIASIISIELSIILNFIFHENWTFKNRSHQGRVVIRFLKFNITSAGSPVIQLISILTSVRIFNLNEQVGLAFGVTIGLFANYFLNVLWVWKEHPQAVKLEKAKV